VLNFRNLQQTGILRGGSDFAQLAPKQAARNPVAGWYAERGVSETGLGGILPIAGPPHLQIIKLFF
jgi:hypothetical protein